MDTILTARSMSQTESDDSDTDILKYAFLNQVPEFEEISDKIIHHPTARFLNPKANVKKTSSFDFLGSPAKQPRLEMSEPEANARNQLPIQRTSTNISDTVTLETDSKMQVILPTRHAKITSAKSTCDSEGCHQFSYGDFNDNVFKSKDVLLEETKFIKVETNELGYDDLIPRKEFPSTKFYSRYIRPIMWSYSFQSDLVQYITVNEKDLNQNRVQPELKSVSFSGFSEEKAFNIVDTRSILKPVYRLQGVLDFIDKHLPLFLKESDFDSNMELALIEQDERERNPPAEKRRKLNEPDECVEEDEENYDEGVEEKYDDEVDEKHYTEVEEKYDEYLEEKQMEKVETKQTEEEKEDNQEDENMSTINNTSNATFNEEIEKNVGIFTICNELTNESQTLSVDLSTNPIVSDYIYNPFVCDLVVSENVSKQSSLEVPDNLESRQQSIENQYYEIINETAIHNPFVHSTVMDMTDIGMFQHAYTDSTDNTMSIPSGELIDSQPYRIFVQSSFSGSMSGTDYAYDEIPYFNMSLGMGDSTGSESRIEDVTDDFEDLPKQIETLFPANDPILSRRESTSCVLVDGLLEYDDDADEVQDEFDLETEQQETLMQPNPQLNYSTSFHSVLEPRGHGISKTSRLPPKRTKSDFFLNQLKLTKSFSQLCRKPLGTSKVSEDASNVELEVCNLQNSSHDQIPVTSSKSVFASVKNSLVACYRRFLSKNRVACKADSSHESNEENRNTPVIMDVEINEFDRWSDNMTNCSMKNCLQTVLENDEVCITNIYEKRGNTDGSFLFQNLGENGILMDKDSFQDSQLIVLPHAALPTSNNNAYNQRNSVCDLNFKATGEKPQTHAVSPALPQPDCIVKHKECETLQPQEITQPSKPLNSKQKLLEMEKVKKSSKESKESPAKLSILKRFCDMFHKLGRKSNKTNISLIGISSQHATKIGPPPTDESITVNANNNEKAAQSQPAPNSNAKSDKILAHHTDSRELYRERRRKFFREQKEFRDESIMAYFTNIIGASQQSSLNPSKHISVIASPTIAPVISPELLIPAALPVLSLLNQSKSDEILVTARTAMSECLVPARKKRLGQSLLLKMPPVVPIIAAAVAKVQQESIKENSSWINAVNAYKAGLRAPDNTLTDEPACPSQETKGKETSNDNNSSIENHIKPIAYPIKGILRKNKKV
ncbi:unnamed protein product [Orchesella dallaii]|uniref:Uncharacterized protein n=1 Tax=Orchesella dallaii TaxID=48710 RepID=A0ABP1S6Q2_9HEXA